LHIPDINLNLKTYVRVSCSDAEQISHTAAGNMAAAEQLIAPGDPIRLLQLADRSLSFTSCTDKPQLFIFTQAGNSDLSFLHICDALTVILLFFLQCLWPHSVTKFTMRKYYSEPELMSPFSNQTRDTSVTTSEVRVLRSMRDII
jgi:hypothetical protein